MKVSFLIPARGSVPFYDAVTGLMRVAAPQLDVELELIEGDFESETMIARGRELAARASRPDYVLLVNYLSVATELIPVFAAAELKTFLVVEGLNDGDRVAIGRAGRASYLGEIVPDDFEAGRLLAELLVDEARRGGLGAGGEVRVGVLGGVQSQAASQRFRGWQAFKGSRAGVTQSGFHYGSWTREAGRIAATALLRSAPGTDVLWCFNDDMALGASDAARALGRTPGKDLLVAGIDMIEPALAAVRDGVLLASLGGHIIDGVRALLALDEHRGAGWASPRVERTRLEAVQAAEAGRHLEFLQAEAWRDVDYTRFSARRNPGEPREELSLRALVTGPAGRSRRGVRGFVTP
ncbi:MAG TPA: substrate-binding domain-containing protein [Anaeromyxobacter sp.]|nr:substrate-binding domain-containing protein [Anaeromyxobacter sp.]